MSDFVFNQAKGRAAELYNRVQTNDPANSALIIVALQTSGLEADSVLMDYATLDAVIKRGGSSAVAEVTNSGYARKSLTDAVLTGLVIDDVGNKVDLGLPTQTWSAVAAGTGWSKLIVCYDNDTTSGTDANIVPMTGHDFVVVPDGSDIIATITDFYRAS